MDMPAPGVSKELKKQKVNLESWPRRAHFEFFRKFEEPYWGTCVNLDCTSAFRFAKRNGLSVFLTLLHRSLTAAQDVEAFRYRLDGDDVYIYDRIDGGSTVDRSDGTFGFGHFPYYAALNEFMANAVKVVAHVRASNELTRTGAPNVIRYTSLPWIDFTSLSHAHSTSIPDSCPRISFGKITEKNGRKSMPVAIHVHHALVDGRHVGQYVETFQRLLLAE